MPRKETRTLYTLTELKDKNPDAFAKVLEHWRDLTYQDSAPWMDETMESLKAVIKACGGTLTDWSIGANGGYCIVSVDDQIDTDEEEDIEGEVKMKDASWLLDNVLKPNGYVDEHGNASFPGLCKWTGYCADDNMIESVHAAMVKGDTLKEALEGLADVASGMMADDLEQQAGEESMLANWEENEYTEDGTEA